jgi:hypothetical protein
VHAKVAGERTPENVLKFFREAHAACDAHGRHSVLLEMGFSGPSMSAESIYRVVSQRSGEAMKLRKIAYVETGDYVANARFAETVAFNRGVNVRLFPDIASAARWLEE